MGWENPPVSWRELERRLSWNVTRLPPGPERNQKPRRRAVTFVPSHGTRAVLRERAAATPIEHSAAADGTLRFAVRIAGR